MIICCCGRPRSDVPPRARGWAAAGAEVGLQPGGAAGGRRHHPRQVQAAAEGGQRRGYRQPPHQVQGPYHQSASYTLSGKWNIEQICIKFSWNIRKKKIAFWHIWHFGQLRKLNNFKALYFQETTSNNFIMIEFLSGDGSRQGGKTENVWEAVEYKGNQVKRFTSGQEAKWFIT